MSVLVGDGGEVVAMNGHTPVAQSECVAGINGAGRNGSADGAGHAAGSDPAPPGLYAGGRNLVK